MDRRENIEIQADWNPQIEFADANNTKWHVENRWFVNQTGLKVRLKKREVRRSQASEKP